MHVWNLLHAARWNTGRKNDVKNRHLGIIAELCRAISSQLRHVSTFGKKLVKWQYVLHMSSEYSELQPINGWDPWASFGHSSKFQRFSRFGFVTAATSLNRSRPTFTLCSAVSWPGILYIHFRQLLSPDGILSRAKFILCPATHHRTSLSGCIFGIKACIDNRNKAR